jgi:hypothetical protein
MSLRYLTGLLSALLRPTLAAGVLVCTALLVGCGDVPDSVEVSRGPDGKVNVTTTHMDATTDVKPEESPVTADLETADSDADLSTVSADTSVSDEKPNRVFSSTRAPARAGEAEKISFDDLVIGLQADVVYRPWMMGDRPKELDGKKVRLSGYMHGGVGAAQTKEFVLLRNLECKFGPGGQADHLTQVYMKPGTTTHYSGKEPIKVEGTLKIEPFIGTDGNTWSLYRIEDAAVVR